MTEALKSCPFCGAQPELHPISPDSEGSAWARIECPTPTCVAVSGQTFYSSAYDPETAREQAVEAASAAWNRRADPSAAEEAGLSVAWAKLTEEQRQDIEAHIAGLTSDAETYDTPRRGWQCFHCGETFKTEIGARLHFGERVTGRPACIGDRAAIEDAIHKHVKVEWSGRAGMGAGYQRTGVEEAADEILRGLHAAAASPADRSDKPRETDKTDPSAAWRGIEGKRQPDPAGFVALVQANPGFWQFEYPLKYLTMTIDTREPTAFWLADRDGNSVEPLRVLAAIQRYQEFLRPEASGSVRGLLHRLDGEGLGASRTESTDAPRFAAAEDAQRKSEGEP